MAGLHSRERAEGRRCLMPPHLGLRTGPQAPQPAQPDVFGFILGSVPGWLLGTEVDLIESGVLPNRTYSVRRREQLRELGTDADGND
jgi:hypothetical protein